jgi:hypothetical protein
MREEKDRRHEAVQGHTRAIARRRIALFGKDLRTSYGGVLATVAAKNARRGFVAMRGQGAHLPKRLIHWLSPQRQMSRYVDHP